MTTFAKLQKLPHKTKVNIMQLICLLVALILVTAWVFTSQITMRNNKDISIFSAIGQSFSAAMDRITNK